MIQDAAAKCRFCGEWLDPTKRPDWSQPAAIASSAPPESGGLEGANRAPLIGAPSPEFGNRKLDPSATTTDGSLHRPRRRATQTWAAPAWMAREDEPASDKTAVPEDDDAVPTLQGTPIEPHRPPAPTVEIPAVTPAETAPPVEHTIDDVADRMRRIKESAAAVRKAMLRESDLPQSDVLGDENPVEAAVTMHAGARSTVRADEPKPEPPPDVAAMLGGDDDLDGGDDELDDDFADVGQARATSTSSRQPGNSKQAGDFTDDDALPAKGALAGLGFGDDDFGDDDDDFDGDFGDVGAGRPIPWKPVAIGAAVVVVLGVGFFWSRIFPPDAPEADPSGEEASNGEDKPADDGQVAQGSVVPTPGQGQPVVPEGQQPAAVVAAPADANALLDANAAPVVPNAAPVDANAAPVVPNAAVDPNAVLAPPAAIPAAPVGASTPLPAETIAVLDEARALWTKAGKKRLGQAKEKLQGILATHPNSADALLLMAQVQLELGEFDASLETATRCTTVGPQTADCWLTLGVLKQEAKDKPAAANAYERYLALAPEGAYASDAKKQLSRLK